ncbi:hypothetical protein [Arcticibacter tournemirensis]|nr:hypothetical protein [Arcticibacter tournemirensis]
MAIRHAGAGDSQLLDIKHDLYDQMMQRKMDRKERRAIYDFLAYYVRFEKTEMIRKFLRLFVLRGRREIDFILV